MRKSLVMLMAGAMVFATTSVALAAGSIEPSVYYKADLNQGMSVHPEGTWNSPYTVGVDGYNYNDAQDYVKTGDQVDRTGGTTLDSDPYNNVYTAGPHGGYLTSTHKCRECHAVHRAAGKFKLTRSDTRFEACDWCHGTGAGSGFNIQMDNDDAYTREYNVGHSMGFGVESGKWKAPDDTYPAYTPKTSMGGFSCFDCHSPHANPQRLLGFNDAGVPVGLTHFYGSVTPDISSGWKVYGIVNPGHGSATGQAEGALDCSVCHKDGKPRAPLYLSGSWLLIKNPDREIAGTSSLVPGGIYASPTATEPEIPWFAIDPGEEIQDFVTAGLKEFDSTTSYPVNKVPIDWNSPVGIANDGSSTSGWTVRNSQMPYWSITEFCTDCHDGNAGLHTDKAPLFSEDRALRENAMSSGADGNTDNHRAFYDLAYGHDSQPRHCARQMKFNPEDNQDFGPHCRNCHRGSSGCARCHSEGVAWLNDLTYTADNSFDARDSSGALYGLPDIPGTQGRSTFNVRFTSTNFVPGLNQSSQSSNNFLPGTEGHGSGGSGSYAMYKTSRTVTWVSDWRTSSGAVPAGTVNGSCSDDGFSWPHRTLGFKMLKDDLFGLDFTNSRVVNVGDSRWYDTNGDGTSEEFKVHDLDSVCIDCHNPTVWRATSGSHEDSATIGTDNHNDELLTRGLP